MPDVYWKWVVGGAVVLVASSSVDRNLESRIIVNIVQCLQVSINNNTIPYLFLEIGLHTINIFKCHLTSLNHLFFCRATGTRPSQMAVGVEGPQPHQAAMGLARMDTATRRKPLSHFPPSKYLHCRHRSSESQCWSRPRPREWPVKAARLTRGVLRPRL